MAGAGIVSLRDFASRILHPLNRRRMVLGLDYGLMRTGGMVEE